MSAAAALESVEQILAERGRIRASPPTVGIYPTMPFPLYFVAYQEWVEMFNVSTVILPKDGEVEPWFQRLDALLIPGGGGQLQPFAAALIRRAIQAHSEGDYFPVWGTCLGFEWIVQTVGGEAVLQSGFDAVDLPGPWLNLTDTLPEGRLLTDANTTLLGWLRSPNGTYEDHTLGIEPTSFARAPALAATFDMLAHSVDRRGRPYVAMIQGKAGLPIYGTQFHPEKIRFVQNDLWRNLTHNASAPLTHIPKTHGAEAVSDYFASFFASEARRSSHHSLRQVAVDTVVV